MLQYRPRICLLGAPAISRIPENVLQPGIRPYACRFRSSNLAWNAAIIALGAIALIALWFAIRQQTAVDDRQFLKSMIPHHAGAILMCEQADLHDPEILALCASIIEGQQAEIDRMHAMLAGSGNATPASAADR